MNKPIKQWISEIYEDAESHGLWDNQSTGDFIAWCHSEISEAYDQDRRGNSLYWHNINKKPEGMAVELADVVILIWSWFGKNNLDFEQILEEKVNYNKSRAYRHGKRY